MPTTPPEPTRPTRATSRTRSPAATLAAAFQDDPLLAWVTPDAARRQRVLPSFFGAVVSRSRALGGVVDVDRGGGVAAWVPADQVAITFLDLLRFGMIRTPLWVGFAGAGRLRLHDEVSHAAVARHASPGDAYLWVLGADPARRGQGCGRRAVEGCATQARAAGAGRLLLVTENPRNVSLYQHLGFDLVDEEPLPGSGLTVWTFRRDLE